MFLPKKFKTALSILSAIAFFLLPSSAMAAEVYINPATGTIENNTFSATVTLDPLSDTGISNVHLFIKYDPLLLQVNSVNPGNLQSYEMLDYNPGTGIIEIQATTPEQLSGITDVANISFTVLTETGFVDLQVLNTPENTSRVIDSTNTNLLNNQATASLLVDIQTTTTFTPTTMTQEASTSIPQTGYSNNFFFSSAAALLIAVGLAFKSYAKSER